MSGDWIWEPPTGVLPPFIVVASICARGKLPGMALHFSGRRGMGLSWKELS